MTLTHRFLLVIQCLFMMGLLVFSNNALYAETDNNTDGAETSEKKEADTEKKEANGESSTAQAESQIEDSMANIEIIQQTLESLRSEIENSKEKTSLNRNSVKTIKEGLELIDKQLKEAYSGLDESNAGINTNSKTLSKISKDLLTITREIRANAADLVSQKSLIEDNSIRLYELLIQISHTGDKVEKLAKALDSVKKTDYTKQLKAEIYSDINRLWTLFAIILVFLTPLAFSLSNHRQLNTSLSNGKEHPQVVLMICLAVFLSFIAVGFGLMYGTTSSGWVGTTSHLLEYITAAPSAPTQQTTTLFPEFLLYQTGFVILAAMIIYRIVGKRLSCARHLLLAVFVAAALIPIFGHWTWSNNFVTGNYGWLEGAGFIDESGALTVNAVAAWFALIIIIKLGRNSSSLQQTDQEVDAPVYSTSAVLVLWLSWLGLTTGTLPITNEQISTVMLNIGIAGSTGGLIGFLHHAVFSNTNTRITSGLGGFVSGLVAIAACAQNVTFAEAAVIGAIAGQLHIFGYSFLRKTFLQHASQTRAAHLIAIHGIAGIWGALCVGLFASDGNFTSPNISQLVTQVQGVAAALVYSFAMANIIMVILAFRLKKQATPA